MRIVFLGTGAFARPTLKWLAQSGHQVVLVVTQPARPSGRGRRLVRTPTGALADELGLEVTETPDVNDPEVVDKLRALDARLGLVIDFGQKLGPELLNLMPGGCINLHASLLPKYRGAAPINWAIVNGEERTGCTVFRVVERMDAGPILVSRWTAIKPEETAHALREFQGEKWLYTGDVAKMDEDGYFTVVDRAKDMLIVGGFKVFSREVEETLYTHPAVGFCAIVGLPNPDRPDSEIVKAMIQLTEGHADRDQDELRNEIADYCNENMAPYKRPKVIEFVDELPLTTVGKVDKKVLR